MELNDINNKLNIISTFYISNYVSSLNNERTNELISALRNNINNENIEKIHLFVDNIESLNLLNKIIEENKSTKIVVIEVGKKPMYSDFFIYILNNLQNKICMIINADIYLSDCDFSLINRLNNEKIMYCLTRYEHDNSSRLIDDYGGSHDCYIFNSKFIDKNIINEHTNLFQNQPGIETHIIKTFYDLGFTMYNPCKQIKIIHLHKSQLRNYNCSGWIGLHPHGDFDYFYNSCWCIPPKIL